MAGRGIRRTVTFALVVMVVAGFVPMAPPLAPVVASPSTPGAVLDMAAARAEFLTRETDDGAAEAAAEEMSVEVAGEDTGAKGGADELGPIPEGANPLPPEPGESVLPEPAERGTSAEPITIEGEAPPALESDPDADLATEDEVVAKRTERSKTYANGDGTFTTESSMAPLHVEHRGGWTEIDVELHESADGDIQNGMASVDISLADDGSSDELAVVGLDGGTSVAFGLEGAAAVEPEIDGAVATYEEILPGVDLELESVPGGLKETAVLASVDAPSELTFPLDLEGLTAELEQTGGVVLRDGAGEVVTAIPPGFMIDSSPGEGARSDAVAYALEERAGQQVLVVTPDRAWLEDPARVWPVRVDPTIVDRTPFDDTYVKSGQSADRSGAVELRAGLEGGAQTAAYMKFYLNIPANSFISAASLHAHNTYSAGGCTAKPISVHRVTQSWTGSTMTSWPGATYASTPDDTRSFAYGGGPSCPANWAAWDVTPMVDDWVKGTHPNLGLTLRVPSGSSGDAGAGKRFTSIEGSTQDAIIRVTYSPWGADYNPGGNWISGHAATNNTTGKWPIQIRNDGSATWTAGSDIKLGTRVYLPSQQGSGTPVAQHRTELPEDISPNELFGMNANVPALPPGTYHVFFEMVWEGYFWFSAEDPWNPRVGVEITIFNQVPEFLSNSPASGDTVDTRRPQLSVVGHDPDDYGMIIEYLFRICPGPAEDLAFPNATSACQSSGWQTADEWTPPNPLAKWNEGAYWWAFIRDRTGPEPRFAQPAMIVPTPAQTSSSDLGGASATASDGGVNVRTGGFTSAVTDLSIGWGPSTFAITRTYNSADYLTQGAMGRGWASLLDVRIDTPLASGRPESFTLIRGDGRRETWAKDAVVAGAGEEVYKGPLGSSDTLTWDLDTSRYVWRTTEHTEYRFNLAGYLTSISRPGLPEITVTRSSPTSPLIQTFEVGAVTVSVDWSSGRVSSIRTTTPGSDARWRYSYDSTLPLLTSVCDPRPAGQRGCHTYEYQTFPMGISGGGKGPLSVARVQGQLYLQLQHEADSSPRVQWRRDGEGHQWNYGYSSYSCPGSGTTTVQCRRATVTQPNPTGLLYPGSAAPEPLVFEFDRFDRLVKRFNERGQHIQWMYDALGFLYYQIDENGIGRAFWHDQEGHLAAVTETREAHPTAPVFSTTLYEYPTGLKRSDPRWGLPIWIYDPRVSDADRTISEATWLRYDTQGRLLQRTTPATDDAPVGRNEFFSYVAWGPAAGQLQTSTDHAGRVTTNSYDSSGRLLSTVTPTGLQTVLTYTTDGRIASATQISDAHPSGVATTMEYDEIGQLIRVVGPPVANVVDDVTRQLVVERTYDASRRLVAETEVGSGSGPNRTTQWTEFDGNSRPTEVVDPEGNVTTTEWTWRGQARTTTTGSGLRMTNQYARTGQVARVLATDMVESPGQEALLGAYSYDEAGRIGEYVDARGLSTSFTYWDDGRPRRTTINNYKATPTASPVSRIVSDVTYDLAGNPIIEQTRNMTLITARTYDMNNALTKEETGGRYVSYDHRPDGLVESMTVGDGSHADVTEYGYTGLPAVQPAYTAQHRGPGLPTHVTGFDYDDRSLLVGVSAPGGRQTDMVYDALGRLVRTTGPAVTVEGYGASATTTRPVAEAGYNAFSEVIQEQAPDGTTETTSYDLLGRPLTLTLPPYTPEPGITLSATLTYAYDDAARTMTTTDNLRNTTTIERSDHLGRVIETEVPLPSGATPGGVTSIVRSVAGDVLATMGPQGQVGEYTYDNTGSVTRAREVERYGTPGTYETSYVYDAELDLVSTTPPGGAAVTYQHNAFGELTATQMAGAGPGVSSIANVFARDHRGRVVRTQDSLGRAQESTFDQAGLLTQSRTYNGSTLLRFDDYTYDANLNLEAVTTPGPNPGTGRVTTSYQHDAQGQVTAITEPGGLATSYGYDISGQLVRSTDGNGNPTWFTYTPWGDIETVVDPATAAHPAAADRTWRNTYEAPGRPSRRTAPGGVTTEFAYDALGNPVSVSGSGGDGAASQTMEWDVSGRLLAASSPAGTTQFAWDDRGNVIGTSGVGGTSSFSYDGAGRMTSRTDAGASSTFTYWSNGLLKTATGNQTGVTEQYAYDGSGALKTLTYPMGTTRAFTYDGFGNMATDILATGYTMLAGQGWAYGADGAHVASTTIAPAPVMGTGVESYTYDGAGRLASTTRAGSTVATTWDGAGNRLTDGTTTSTYDQRNRLLTSGAPGAVETYQWTPRGTLDSVTSASGTTDYQFDAFDRLTREVGSGVDDQYQWDGLDRLATIDGAAMSYAGFERDPVKVPGQVYERGPGGGVRAFEPSSGTAQFVRSNQRGDFGSTFVPGATTATSSRAYTPFGQPTSGGTPQPSFGFQGDWTSGSGLVHMDARFYDPATGTFISRDSVNLGVGPAAYTNRYTYGAANPVSNTDPTGHWPSFGGWGKDRGINAKGRQGGTIRRAQSPCLPPSGSGGFAFAVCRRPRLGARMWKQQRLPARWRSVDSGPSNDGHRSDPDGVASNWGPSKPKPPPKPLPPWWIDIKPDRPPPDGHAKPLASASYPIIEGSMTLLFDPMDVPLASYMPSTSSTPYAVNLSSSGDLLGEIDDIVECGLEHGRDHATERAVGAFVYELENCDPAARYRECVILDDLFTLPPGVHACDESLRGPPDDSLANVLEEAKKLASAVGFLWEGGDALSCFIGNLQLMWGSIGPAELASDCVAMVPGVGSPIRSAFREFALGDDGGSGEEGGECRSFSASTLVLLANGERRAIADVREGDMVLATDPGTGETGPREVVATLPHTDRLVTLETSSGGIVTTEDHEYWNVTDGEWQESQDLDRGDRLLSADGDEVTAEGLDWSTAHTAQAYDLTIEDIHTFYVAAGAEDVLVHNACSNAQILRDNMESRGWYTEAGGMHAHHIVPHGKYGNRAAADSLARAQAKLREHGIDINDADNGVYLPGRCHLKVGHTNEQFRNLDRGLSRSESAAETREILRGFARELEAQCRHAEG